MLSQATSWTRKSQVTLLTEVREAPDIHEGGSWLVERVAGRMVLERVCL